MQITSAIKAVHSASLAVRNFEPSKILVTGKNRIRLNACGVLDIVQYGSNQNVANQQQEDLIMFGQLIVALATGSLSSIHHLQKSVEYISKTQSPELKNVVMYLLSKPSHFKNIDDVIVMLGPQILNDINSAHV